MRKIGIHLRLEGSFVELAERAKRLGVRIFQCFFLLQEMAKLASPSQEEIDRFVRLRSEHFDELYLHGSYWINLAGIHNQGHRALDRELALAKKLAFTHIVLHPGSAKGADDKREGIDALARSLNNALKKERDIIFVLENTAHGNMTVGSDINDFGALLEKLDTPARIQFCIDTSHAYAYGYDIVSDRGREDFIALLEKNIGLSRVVLLHINDSKHEVGRRIDRHMVPGSGVIGEQALRNFALHPKLRTIPIVIEPPVLFEDDERILLEQVRGWE